MLLCSRRRTVSANAGAASTLACLQNMPLGTCDWCACCSSCCSCYRFSMHHTTAALSLSCKRCNESAMGANAVSLPTSCQWHAYLCWLLVQGPCCRTTIAKQALRLACHCQCWHCVQSPTRFSACCTTCIASTVLVGSQHAVQAASLAAV